MSLLFDDSSSQYLERTSTIPSLSLPFAIAAWVYIDDTAGSQTIVSLVNNLNDNENYSLMLEGGIPKARARSSGSNGDADSTHSITANSWHHVLAVFKSSSEREIYLDGRVETRGTDTTVLTPSGLNTYSVGRLSQLTPGNYASGKIAEVSIWNLTSELNPQEMVSLGQDKYSALFIQFENLIVHDRLLGNLPTVDSIGSFSLTAFNGPSEDDHPLILQPGHEPSVFGGSTVFPQEDILNLTQDTNVVLSPLLLEVVDTFQFFHFGNSNVIELAIQQNLSFSDLSIHGPNTLLFGISDQIIFQDLGRDTLEESVLQILTFSDSANQAGSPDQQLIFSQSAAALLIYQSLNTLNFNQQALLEFGTQAVNVNQTLSFTQVAGRVLETENCSLDDAGIQLNGDLGSWAVDNLEDASSEIIAPDKTSLIISDTIEFFTLLGIASPTLTLRSPDLGNTELHVKGNLIQRLRGGAPVSAHIPSKPRIRRLTITSSVLKSTERDAIQVFLNETLGTKIRYTDHNSQIFIGIIVNPDTAIEELHTNQFRATFELELSNDSSYVET